MNIRCILLILLLDGMFSYDAVAQSHWIGNMPMQFNPSFAGSSGEHRISSLVPYQVLTMNTPDSIHYDSRTFGADLSYDNFIHQISSGIGFNLSYTNQQSLRVDGINEKIKSREDYHLSDLHAAFTISPKISIQGKYTLAPSIQVRYNYVQRSRFYMEPNFSQPGLAARVMEVKEIKNALFSLTAGMLFNTQKLYLGYSVLLRPIGQPVLYTLTGFSFEPRSVHYIQAGYRFQRSSDSKISFTPQLVIRVQSREEIRIATFVPNLINFTFRYKNWIAGISNRGIMAGYQNEKIRIAYVQDLFPDGSVFLRDPYLQRVQGELSFRIAFPKKFKTYFAIP
jgi:hypothetical protein